LAKFTFQGIYCKPSSSQLINIKSIYKYLFTSIHNNFFEWLQLLFCAWRHVSAAHAAIFRPA